MVSFLQCKAARAIIGWSQDQLVEASKVTKSTIANFESGKSTPYSRTLLDIQTALETAGIEFLEDGACSQNGGAGVRLKAASDMPRS